jgi:hypothetical protein
MHVDQGHGRRRLRVDPAANGVFWRYEGIGWPRSLTGIRLWIPGTVVLVALTIWGYVAVAPNGRIVVGHLDQHRTDFTVFTEAGAAFFDGRDPYRVANPRGWHYLYPPLFALLVAPLSAFDTQSQVVIWYALNVVLSALCFCEMRRLWRRVVPEELRQSLWVVACALLAASLPYLDCMQAGQLGIAILYLLLLGFRLTLRADGGSRRFLAGLILAVPAVIKLVPALPVAFLVFQHWAAVFRRRPRPAAWIEATTFTAGVSTGVLLLVFAVPASIIGWRANLAHLDRWYSRIVANERVGPDANFNIHSYRNQSLANAVYLLRRGSQFWARPSTGATSAADRLERIAHPAVPAMVTCVLAVLLIVGASVGSREDPLDRITAYGLACCASLVVSPLSWGHYYMALAPSALFVPIHLLRRGRSSRARWIAVLPPVLIWTYYLAMPYTGGMGLLGLGTALWFLVACGSLLDGRGVRRSTIGRPHSLRRGRPSHSGQRRAVGGASAPPRPASRLTRGLEPGAGGIPEPVTTDP